MADIDSKTKHQQLLTEQNQGNPCKFYTHFLYKALIIAIFLVILPMFPSQAPEFVKQTVLTRSWEFLQLLFVGIAVSYGLFSRRNDDTEKENNSSKFDNAQSYVSRFLQVSSVFDEENENSSGSDESKVQTWSNQYYRNEPMVVVAKDHSALEEQRGISSRINDKPLFLPVRSLKSRVLEADVVETSKESGSLSRSSSNLSSKTNKMKKGELGGLDHVNLAEKLNGNVVLPSPIPWRSRSGRIEVKEAKEDIDNPPVYTLPPSKEESEFNRVDSRSLRPQTTRSSRPNSTSSSPKLSPSPSLSSPRKLSPSHSLLSESLGKTAEDLVRKKSFYRSSPPPPPPPPPPMMTYKSSPMKPVSNSSDDRISFEKDLRRSYTSEGKDFNRSGGEMSRVKSGMEMRPMGKSIMEMRPMGKSIRKIRQSDSLNGARKDRDIEDGINCIAEKRSKETESTRKTVGFDQTSYKTEKLNRESITFMPKHTFMEFPKEGNERFVDKMMVETDYDSESEDEEDDYDDDTRESSFVSCNVGSSNNEEASSSVVSDGGPDVDKKADEFIAKFREQIRLQRIESIKKSSAQISRRNSSR